MGQTLRVAPRIPKEVDLRRKVCCRLRVTRLPRLMPVRFSAVDCRLDILMTHAFSASGPRPEPAARARAVDPHALVTSRRSFHSFSFQFLYFEFAILGDETRP